MPKRLQIFSQQPPKDLEGSKWRWISVCRQYFQCVFSGFFKSNPSHQQLPILTDCLLSGNLSGAIKYLISFVLTAFLTSKHICKLDMWAIGIVCGMYRCTLECGGAGTVRKRSWAERMARVFLGLLISHLCVSPGYSKDNKRPTDHTRENTKDVWKCWNNRNSAGSSWYAVLPGWDDLEAVSLTKTKSWSVCAAHHTVQH